MKKTGEIKSFEDLECWEASVDVRRYICGLIKKFPETEKYDLVDNMKRASHSVTRNIAEGYDRFHFKENIQFCRQSRGSLYELIDDLISSKDENYITIDEYDEARNKIDRALCILNAYINYLNKALNGKGNKVLNNH